jgi:hypothetical protein
VIRYDGLDMAGKWTRIRSWGGKFVENMTNNGARPSRRRPPALDDGTGDLLTTVHGGSSQTAELR